MPESDVTKMKVADLKRELKLRGLATTGNKTELQDRLQSALLDGDISLEDSAITNEDALLDDDAELTDEEDTPIAADENELLKSPTRTPTTSELASPLNESKSSVDGTDTAAAAATPASPAPKKIILKRKTSYTSDDAGSKPVAAAEAGAATAATAKENTEPPKEKVLKMSERNPITVVDLTDETAGGKKAKVLTQMERLELRAKKFGLNKNTATTTPTAAAAPATTPTLSVKPKVNARISSDIGGGAIINDAKQIEILKKRAERFGCVVSSKMAEIDAAEKLQKRKERFGAGNGTTVVPAAAGGGAAAVGATATKGNDVWAEKARARLERFKNTTPAVPTTTTPTTDKKADISASAGAGDATESTEEVDGKKEATPIVTTPAATPTSPPTVVAGN